MEVVTFVQPVQVEVRIMRIASLVLDWQQRSVSVTLQHWDANTMAFVGNTRLTVGWTGDEAMAKMIALNKANLTTKSLHTRVVEALIADGKIPNCTVLGDAP